MVKLISISPSKIKGKKYTAVFQVGDKTKKTHFGASGYTDFIKSGGDDKRKKAYLARHKKNENWDHYMTAGSLSRWILWNLPTLKASIAHFKKRFKL